MKILVLADRYPPYYEGAYELNCHDVTEGLIARGHQVTVLTSTFGIDNQTLDGHVYRLMYPLSRHQHGRLQRRWIQLKQLFQARQNYNFAQRLSKEINPDLAFLWHLKGASILAILALQDLGIPTVFRIGSHWLIQDKGIYVDDQSRSKKWYRSGLIGFRRFEDLKIDAAIIVSETLKQSYQEAGFDVENMIVIPSGIPEEYIAKLTSVHRSPNELFRMLYVGRLDALKGTHVAVRAVEHLVNVRGYHNVRLGLIGNGRPEYIAELKRLTEASDLQNFVRFNGFLPRSQLMKFYSESDVLLFPTPKWEGLPMTIIEAMAQGVPAIASDIGGPIDIIDPGRNGLLVPPDDPVELAAAIERVIQEPSLVAEMGLAAIETVREKHSFEIMLDQYEAFLQSVVRQSKRIHSYPTQKSVNS